MKLLLLIIFPLTVGYSGHSQVNGSGTFKEVFHDTDSKGNLLEIRRTHLLFESNDYEYINIDSSIISGISSSDTLNDTTYWPIDLLFDGYQEKILRSVVRRVFIDQMLLEVESFEYCLNGQLIEHLPCNERGYVRYYCNGNIKEQTDSCKCFGPVNCLNIGSTKYYYPDGTLKSEGRMVNDLPDGQKRVQIFNVGEWLYYDQSGQLIKKIHWNSYGRIEREEEVKKEKY